MARRLKLSEDELVPKKVFTKIEIGSKSSWNHKRKHLNSKKPNNNPRRKEAVIKITGNTKNFEMFKRHIEYISRDYTLPVYDENGKKYEGEEEIKEFIELYNIDGAIPNFEDIQGKERREVLNFVFSMEEHQTTPADKLMEAVIKSVKEKYPNNPVCFSYHNDTDNPHIHCDLRIQDINNNRIHPGIAELNQLRKDFAKNLNDLGIEAYATRRWEKYNIDKDKNVSQVQEDKSKKHHYEVVDFGKAKFRFDESARDSYFVKYKTTKGEIIDIWGKELEQVIKESDLKVGEFAKFKIVDKAQVEVQAKRFNKKTKKWSVYTKTAFKNVWDISILGRDEKELEKVKVIRTKDKKVVYKTETVMSDLDIKTAEFIKMKKEREEKKAQDQKFELSSTKKSNRFGKFGKSKKDDRDR